MFMMDGEEAMMPDAISPSVPMATNREYLIFTQFNHLCRRGEHKLFEGN